MSEDQSELDPTELPSTEASPAPSSAERQQIGPYRLLQKLGEGGMGEVWEAEQTEPVRRKVALKLIKLGMDTRQVVARFEAERQALAMMDHPAIAKVYDAGATPQGRPYFVMEHVKGVPLTEHCDRQKLTNRERLDLFMQVCEGVQHAHQKAVIHRDLKPSNVLVSVQDGKAVPKIIDFGVAKATAQKLTDKTMHTQLGVLVGTPAYMSPEQAEMTGQDIDTRTDVYALGVMLYELLVGALPFDPKDFHQAGLEAMVRKIREDEPSKPSAKLTTLGEQSTESAKRRRTELPALKRELSGDLDWITLKALEKDRTRRYGSPQDLAADIERYLTDQPVLASPPSAAYRARKFVRRHTWGVVAGTAAALVLPAFAITMAVQAKRIADERDLARQAQADLESVVAFQAGMLGATDPEQMGRRLMENLSERVAEVHRGGGNTERQVTSAVDSLDALVGGVNSTDLALDLVDEDILGAAVETLEEKFGDQPLIDARLRGTIGETYRRLGRYEGAETQLEKALEIRKRALGDDHQDTLRTWRSYADLLWYLGRNDEADAAFLGALEAQKRVLGDEHPDTLLTMFDVAWRHMEKGEFEASEALFLRTLEVQQRDLGPEHSNSLRTANGLASMYTLQGRYDEAEPLYLELLEKRKRVLGDDHLVTLMVMHNLTNVYLRQGRFDEAEPLTLETLETRKRVLGDDHPATLDSMNNLAYLYQNQGRYDEAEPLYLETLETRKRVLGDDHPATLDSMNSLAILYLRQGRYDEAEPFLVATLETRKRVLGDDHPDTLDSMNNLGALRTRQGKYGDAEALFEQALEARRRVLGGEHPDVGSSHWELGFLSASLGKHHEAIAHFRTAVDLRWMERNIVTDPLLDSIRGDPEFEAIVAEVKKKLGIE